MLRIKGYVFDFKSILKQLKVEITLFLSFVQLKSHPQAMRYAVPAREAAASAAAPAFAVASVLSLASSAIPLGQMSLQNPNAPLPLT